MKLRFTGKKHEVDDVWSFFFDPVEPLTWIAGQSIRLELPRASWGMSERRFTIASAPYEKHVQITTRVSHSEFKQALNTLQPDQEINGFNIEGDFVWEESDSPKLFLAAGIGITPFRSIIAEQIKGKKPLNTTLLYGSSLTRAIFQDELEQWQEADKTFRFYTVQGKRLSIEKDASLSPQWQESLVYVSGPTQMVDEISDALIEHGFPKNQIKTDQFTGY